MAAALRWHARKRVWMLGLWRAIMLGTLHSFVSVTNGAHGIAPPSLGQRVGLPSRRLTRRSWTAARGSPIPRPSDTPARPSDTPDHPWTLLPIPQTRVPTPQTRVPTSLQTPLPGFLVSHGLTKIAAGTLVASMSVASVAVLAPLAFFAKVRARYTRLPSTDALTRPFALRASPVLSPKWSRAPSSAPAFLV